MSSEVPEGWRAGRFGEFLKAAQGGGTPPRNNPDYWGRDIPWASVKDVTSGASEPLEWITAEGLKNSTSRRVAAGTNILAMRMAVGSVIRYGLDVAINQDLVALIPADSLDSNFLFHWLRHHSSRFADVATGTTVKGLRKDILLDWPILLPSLEEQWRIAEVVQSVDEAVSSLRQTCDAYERLRLAEVENFAHASLGGDARPLESLISSMDSGWSPDCDGEPATGDDWGVLKTSAVTWEGFDDRQNKRLPDALSPRPALAVARDDILITRAGPAERTGVVAIVRSTVGRRMLSDKLIRLRARDDLIEPLALAELLRSEVVQDQFRALKSGMAASQTNISQKTLRGVSIPTASRESQLAFVARITNLDAALDAERQALLTARRLQTCISADLLSGRVRVPA